MRFLRLFFCVALTAVCLGMLDLPAVASSDPDAEEPAYQRSVDNTFPTAEASARTPIEQEGEHSYGFIDDYHNGRGNKECGVHRATDIFGKHGQPVHAAVGGTVTFMPEEVQSSGWMIRIAGDDGRTYSYVHLGRQDGPRRGAYVTGLEQGDEVERGQHIGYLGSSGNASEDAPHLHFEIRDDDDEEIAASNEWDCPYYNPYASLKDAIERGDLPEPAPNAPTAEVDRIAGPERVATAAALSREAFADGADHVVIAAAESFPDSIVAGPLAAALDAPVLTTYGHQLHAETAAEIDRLGATSVTVVDGAGFLTSQVLDDLVEAGVPAEEIEHIHADSPPEVAAKVARRVWDERRTRDALVALGSHEDPERAWPDALTGGYHGAVSGLPVLFVTPDAVPAATATALSRAVTATIVGGVDAVSIEVEEEVAEHVDTVRRLAGRNRYETSLAITDDLLRAGFVTTERVWAATARNFADALTAAGAVARAGEAFVLIDGTGQGGDASIDPWLRSRAEEIERGRVIGGTAAVSEGARVILSERIS